MKLNIQTYDSVGTAWNAEAEETALLSYSIEHQFNRPAMCLIVLKDPTGAKAQEYDVAAADVHIGAVKVSLEDPTGVDIFLGRIVKARHNSRSRTCVLYCEDWMSQLDEGRIDYDMREAIDGATLRESTAQGVTTGVNFGSGGYAPVETTKLHDSSQSWANDLWNITNPNSYVVFPNKSLGKVSQTIGPYDEVVTGLSGGGTDTPATGEENVWDDMTTYHNLIETAGNGTAIVTYKFRNYHHGGSLMQAGSISACRVHMVYSYSAPAPVLSSASGSIMVLDQSTGVTYYSLGKLDRDGQVYTQTFTVPEKYLTSAILCDGSDDTYIDIQIEADGATAADLKVYQILLELELTLDGYSTAISITDTTVGTCLTLGTDVEALGIYETCPYSIARYLYYRINALATGGDPVQALTSSVETSTTITTKNFQGMTRREILADLAKMDHAVFWMPLGTTQVTWKSTFTTADPANLGTGQTHTILNWLDNEYDYEPMRNEYIVYGERVGDKALILNTGALAVDPGSDSKTKFLATRTGTVKSTGTVSEYEAEKLGSALVERDEDVNLFLQCEIYGLSSLRLGSEVEIIDSYLNYADVDNIMYVVNRFKYDSTAHRTILRLVPRSSVGLQEHLMYGEHLFHISERAKEIQTELRAASLHSQEW